MDEGLERSTLKKGAAKRKPGRRAPTQGERKTTSAM